MPPTTSPNELFHILYDGTVMDEQSFTVLGGAGRDDQRRCWRQTTRPTRSCGDTVKLGAKVLAGDGEPLTAAQLEVALLDRNRPSRTFRRIKGDELDGLLA